VQDGKTKTTQMIRQRAGSINACERNELSKLVSH